MLLRKRSMNICFNMTCLSQTENCTEKSTSPLISPDQRQPPDNLRWMIVGYNALDYLCSSAESGAIVLIKHTHTKANSSSLIFQPLVYVAFMIILDVLYSVISRAMWRLSTLLSGIKLFPRRSYCLGILGSSFQLRSRQPDEGCSLLSSALYSSIKYKGGAKTRRLLAHRGMSLTPVIWSDHDMDGF
jgi:hypothetical protein